MLRRTFVRAGAWLVCVGVSCQMPARAHTPYRQWVVYRRKHLLIGCHRQDPETYALAQRLVEVLQLSLPEARARIARAPTAGRLASLLGTDQLDVALVAYEDAAAMAAGQGEFKPYGKIDLKTLFLHPPYALVGRMEIPAKHAWLIAHALHESNLGQASLELTPPLAWHAGTELYRKGSPLPES